MPGLNPPGHEAANSDEVQHDRRDHDVDAAGYIEQASEASPCATNRHGDKEHDGDVQHLRERYKAADLRGNKGGNEVLTLDTDVEQVHAEPDRCRNCRQVQRRRPVPNIDLGFELGRMTDHVAVGSERV